MERYEETIDSELTASENGTPSENSHPMDALLAEEEFGLRSPKRGEIRTGKIARVTETDVLVDVGAKSEGVIISQELEQLSKEERDELVVGKEITVYVIRTAGRDGEILLSLNRAEEEQDWHTAEQLLEKQEVFEGEVSGYNKGGLIVKLGQLRGFIPASQVSLSRRRRAQGDTPEKRWGVMVSEPIAAKVIEVDRRRNRLILSERAAAREARDVLKERLITELKPGEIRTGHVISLAEFGAFIDIGGADGLVHRSEISWKRISHPRELLKVGDTVEVKVLSLDPDRKRISLSMRELEEDPWSKIISEFQEGQLVEGTITKLTKFGAFASLSETGELEIEGLVHISELSDRRIEHPNEVVEEGQVLTLRIIKLDKERRRIGLSLKRVDSPEYAEADWQAAMQDIAVGDEEEQAEEVPEEAPEPTTEVATEVAEAVAEETDVEAVEAEAAEITEEAEPAADQLPEAVEAKVEEDEPPAAVEEPTEVEVAEVETEPTADEQPEVAEAKTVEDEPPAEVEEPIEVEVVEAEAEPAADQLPEVVEAKVEEDEPPAAVEEPTEAEVAEAEAEPAADQLPEAVEAKVEEDEPPAAVEEPTEVEVAEVETEPTADEQPEVAEAKTVEDEPPAEVEEPIEVEAVEAEMEIAEPEAETDPPPTPESDEAPEAMEVDEAGEEATEESESVPIPEPPPEDESGEDPQQEDA